ncbi:MAG: glycosyltransferase family 4 protein [Methyloligellaceae bacterium]
MRVLVATDAWHPQVNGVVQTYERLSQESAALDFSLDFVTPAEFPSIPCPTYPEIRLSLLGPGRMRRRIEQAMPDYIHIATEGPIGVMTRSYCRKARRPFTTSYHTRFPEYIAARFPVRRSWFYALQRRFHNSGSGMMVATPSLETDLSRRGFTNILRWTRGVDTDLFRPRQERLFGDSEPVFLYVGRVAVEKNIKAFLDLELPGRKVIVGGGPQLEPLRAKYPDAIFTGPKRGEDLARHYASANVFVFPSLTDTFGIVLLEALASGVPVAAYPVTGPKDVVESGMVGALDRDLGKAALAALALDPAKCRTHALKYSWSNSARQFIDNIVAASGEARPQKKRPG